MRSLSAIGRVAAVGALIAAVVLVSLILFGGGGGHYYGRGARWRGPHDGGGLLGPVLIILLVLRVSGAMVPGMLR